jgi:PAS domain S-box-containing protein
MSPGSRWPHLGSGGGQTDGVRADGDARGPVIDRADVAQAALVDLEAANRRVSALAELSARLTEAVTRDQVIAAIVAGAEEVVGATRAAFVAVEGSGLDLISEKLPAMLVDYVRQVGVPVESPVAMAARTGEMVLLASPEAIEARFPDAVALAEATGLKSLANLPIMLDGRVIGVLHLGFEADRDFGMGEREFLVALSRLCAQAIERADIFDWEVRVSRLFTEAQTSAEVAELTHEQSRILLGSESTSLYEWDPVTGDLVLAGSPGAGHMAPRIAEPTPTAIGEAFWSGEPVVVADQDEYFARYPRMAEKVGRALLPQASLAMPLRFRGDVVGSVGFGFPSARHFSQRELTLARGMCGAAAAALVRLRLHDVERIALGRQAALARISQFALEATDQMSLALKVIEELRATEGASAATIYLLSDETNELVRLASGGWSEAGSALFARIGVGTPTAATEALRGGKAVYVEDSAAYGKRWPGTIEAFRAEGFEAFASLRLALPDRAIGAMTVGFPDRRLFGTDERTVLETLAATAAQGLERLRAQAAERRAVQRQTAVARIARFALEASDETALAAKVIEEIAGLEGSTSAGIYRLDADNDELVLLAEGGWAESLEAKYRRVSLSMPSAATEAVRTGQAIYVRDLAEYSRLWPAMVSTYQVACLQASAILPLAVPGRTTGAITIGFRDRHVFDAEERTTLETIAATAAQGLERLRAQDAERTGRKLLEAVVAQMPVGVRVLSTDGHVLLNNQVAVAPWGVTVDTDPVADLQTSPATHADGRPYREDERPGVRSARRGETVVDEEVFIKRADGSPGVLAISSSPVRDDTGKIVAAVAVSVDITDRKDQERSRDAFMAILSHELRTPMTTILAATKILQTRGGAMDQATLAGLYDDIGGEADRLSRMVENLLVLSRVDRGLVHALREPVLLGRLLQPRIDAEQAFWPGSAFKLRCADRLPIIAGDVGFIEHIIRNLLSNAAKYAPGDVEIDVAADPEHSEVTVSVSDHGPGIAPPDVPHLFELYWRSAGATQMAQGAGVGLFVVRKLVEAMGGRVWLDETVTEGARFVVALQCMDEGG